MTATTATPAPPARERPATLIDAFALRVTSSPSSVFLSDPTGQEVTYAQARDRVDRLRARLAAAGVAAGDRVGLFLPNAPAWPIASLATWGLGASVTACGTLLARQEAQRAFALAGVRVIVTTDGATSVGDPAEQIVVDALGRLPDDAPAPATTTAAATSPTSEAVVFFTSGTTGTPKGVPHRHADLMTWAEQVAGAYARRADFRPVAAPAGLAPGVIFTPFGHIGGYLSLAFRVWIGRAAVLVPKFSTDIVGRLLERYDFEALQLTPTMVHMLAAAEQDLPLHRLRYVTSSTAPLTAATREAFEQRYGIPVIQAYGMTEVGTIAQERYDDVRAGRRPRGSVGRPAAGVEIRIAAGGGALRPPGAEGEILVRTATASARYMGDHAPELTDGWFHTGDIGRLDTDGFLYITGRRSDRIVVGGFNVYPAEVEDALRTSEHVVDVVVVGVPDDRLGETLVAAVVWRDGPQPEALREHARSALAHYKVPRAWVAVAEVPLTVRGKIDRAAVRELVREFAT